MMRLEFLCIQFRICAHLEPLGGRRPQVLFYGELCINRYSYRMRILESSASSDNFKYVSSQRRTQVVVICTQQDGFVPHHYGYSMDEDFSIGTWNSLLVIHLAISESSFQSLIVHERLPKHFDLRWSSWRTTSYHLRPAPQFSWIRQAAVKIMSSWSSKACRYWSI